MSWDEERAGRAVRARLLRVEPPEGHIEVEQIVRDGRRGERRSRVAAVVGAALVVAVGVPAAVLVLGDPAPTGVDGPANTANCTVTELDRPQEAGTTLEVADPTGTFLYGSSGSHLVRWRNGRMEIVATDDSAGIPGAGLLPGLLPIGVNSSGVAVGIYRGRTVMATTPPLGWVFRDGVLTPLAVPPGVQAAEPSAINDAGDIVGRVLSGTTPGALLGTVVIWPAGSPGSPYLRPRDTPAAEPVAIAADGTVVANLMSQPDQPAWAAVWGPDSARRGLALPDGWLNATTVGIRGQMVYGTVSRWKAASVPPGHGQDDPYPTSSPDFLFDAGTPDERPARWDLSAGTVHVYAAEGVLASFSGTGWLLVERLVDASQFPARQLVLVSPHGEAHELPRVGSGARGVWISDDGRTIHGQAQFEGNDSRPVTWTCE